MAPSHGTSRFDAFLCHASADKPAAVAPFAGAMVRRGLKPWVDVGELKWGDSILRKIQDGLSDSRYAVVFISNTFLGRSWPEAELSSALCLELNAGRKIVLPILLGIDPASLCERYPLLADKMYMSVADYDASSCIDLTIIEAMVNSLAELKQSTVLVESAIHPSRVPGTDLFNITTADPSSIHRFYRRT